MIEKQQSPFENPNRLLDISEAAILLGISTRSVKRRVKEDINLQKIARKYKNRLYFPYGDLIKYNSTLKINDAAELSPDAKGICDEIRQS